MITYLNCEDLLVINDLKKVEHGKYIITGEDPHFEITNIPQGLINEASIVIKAESGEIEFYWTYEENGPYSVSLSSSQNLKPNLKYTYNFFINSEKNIKKLKLTLKNASGLIEIGKIKIDHHIPNELFYEVTNDEKKAKNHVDEGLNFENVDKLSLKGKNGFLFLINDSNSELRQHFDPNYENNFNANLFIKLLKFVKQFCKERNIKHQLFIIPDKSLVCKDFLPFEVTITKRNYDSFNDLVPDFMDKLNPSHYFKYDSHINYLGGKELSFYYLNYMDNNFKRADFDKLIEKQISIVNRARVCDLTMTKNWSYSEEEKDKYPNKEIISLKNKYLIDIRDKLPENLKAHGTRETEYLINPKSFTDLKVLIFRDSSLELLRDTLSIYFKEILLYWDHWTLNKEIIDWYKPNIILEIRTERFLENNFFKRIC